MDTAGQMDQILNPWLYENGGASSPPAVTSKDRPLETNLLSAQDGGSAGTVHVGAPALYSSASRLAGLRTEVEADVQMALRSSDQVAIGRNLEVAKAVQYIHDRWGQKLQHLLEDMDDRVGRIRRAADHWKQSETNVQSSFK